MILELNIGLNVRGSANRLAEVNARAEQALGSLPYMFGSSVQARRCDSEYEDPISGEIRLEHCLIVRAYVGNVFHPASSNFPDFERLIHLRVYQLAQELEQDCIAAYSPELNRGVLIGPNAEAWGEFNLEYFGRFDDVQRAAA